MVALNTREEERTWILQSHGWQWNLPHVYYPRAIVSALCVGISGGRRIRIDRDILLSSTMEPALNRQSRNVTSCLMPEFNDASRFRHILTPLRDSQPRIPSRSMQRHSILFWKLNSESKILNDGRFGKVVDGEFAWWDFAWLGMEILLDRSISSKQKMSSTPLLFSLFQPFFFGLGFLVWYDSLYY